MRNALYVTGAMVAALALASCGGSAKIAKSAEEKCYGVAKAGKNDCASGAHTCAGQALASRSPGDYITVPAGLCDKLVGGTVGA
jgi:uncharacterized membrane protein